jgi:hypothetical protein
MRSPRMSLVSLPGAKRWPSRLMTTMGHQALQRLVEGVIGPHRGNTLR